jgi:hypothetical protein
MSIGYFSTVEYISKGGKTFCCRLNRDFFYYFSLSETTLTLVATFT